MNKLFSLHSFPVLKFKWMFSITAAWHNKSINEFNWRNKYHYPIWWVWGSLWLYFAPYWNNRVVLAVICQFTFLNLECGFYINLVDWIRNSPWAHVVWHNWCKISRYYIESTRLRILTRFLWMKTIIIVNRCSISGD